MSKNMSANKTRFVSLVLTTALASTALAGCTGKVAPEAAYSAAKAEAALEKGKSSKAVQHAEAAVLASPRDAESRALLGFAYIEAGRFQSAAATLGDAVELGDTSQRTVVSYALAQVASGQGNSALKTLDKYESQLDPADFGLAVALAGRPYQGVHVLGNVLRSGRNDVKVRQNLAYAFALQGDWRSARLLAAQDVGADQVGQRMAEWAQTAAPGQEAQRIAALLDVPVAADAGQPAGLALANHPSVPMMAAEAATQNAKTKAVAAVATKPASKPAVAKSTVAKAKPAVVKAKPAAGQPVIARAKLPEAKPAAKMPVKKASVTKTAAKPAPVKIAELKEPTKASPVFKARTTKAVATKPAVAKAPATKSKVAPRVAAAKPTPTFKPAAAKKAAPTKKVAPAKKAVVIAEKDGRKFVKREVVQHVAAAKPTVAAHTPKVASAQKPVTKPASKPAAKPVQKVAQKDGGYRVQLGSYFSMSDAQAAWKVFLKRHPELDGSQKVITKAKVKGKMYYRVAAGGFAKDAAQTMCSQVKKGGAGCIAYAANNPLPGTIDNNVRVASR